MSRCFRRGNPPFFGSQANARAPLFETVDLCADSRIRLNVSTGRQRNRKAASVTSTKALLENEQRNVWNECEKREETTGKTAFNPRVQRRRFFGSSAHATRHRRSHAEMPQSLQLAFLFSRKESRFAFCKTSGRGYSRPCVKTREDTNYRGVEQKAARVPGAALWTPTPCRLSCICGESLWIFDFLVLFHVFFHCDDSENKGEQRTASRRERLRRKESRHTSRFCMPWR
ncbi:hypothetical protein TGME49_213885 [Toxoplasma gondii ME49]|uniref:Uncharacterized protein n=1 Tax=Toxoplasma gondii (strain ATCC 50611 / Me49) TaxID=508771 RepID=S8F602_TOXGM|nr:hypothetical protein TGME49_213885 [Toxoplasma gondii ME49]EPT31271.1 hypothetical protein TGME49_213885 [Toxoplasma gondii ME49]|eukprot:XP_018637910.1 hypothetical protein TGME49_213885 [Toxoplasma gondii ME49]